MFFPSRFSPYFLAAQNTKRITIALISPGSSGSRRSLAVKKLNVPCHKTAGQRLNLACITSQPNRKEANTMLTAQPTAPSILMVLKFGSKKNKGRCQGAQTNATYRVEILAGYCLVNSRKRNPLQPPSSPRP